MAGKALSRSDIDQAVGDAMLRINKDLNYVEAIRDGLQAYSDQEIKDLGYSDAEVATIRSALADMDQLWKIYKGAQPLTDPKDFRQFAKRLWGLGV
jgi:hypothetical protein